MVDTNTRYQTIDGFGAALPMWGSASNMWTTDEVHKFVGLGDEELGMSIVRTIIDPDSGRWSYAVDNLKEAKSYGDGVRILASPWSPPATMKINESTTCGGATNEQCKLKTDSYAAYAAHLNDYVEYMMGQGVAIDVTSIQNEPDWKTDYESCLWSGTDFANFIRDHASAIQNTKIMIPESLQTTRAYSDPTLNDATAVNLIHYIGGHLYGAEAGGKLSPYALAEEKGKPVWMTEYNFHEADGDGAAIWGGAGDNEAVWNETLEEVLDTVHKSLVSNWSAYIWWWGRRFYSFIGDGESAYGTTKGAVLKRGWAFSHYSKYVRPGYVRVAMSTDGSFDSALNMTAYEGDDRLVMVLLNRSNSEYRDVVIETPYPVVDAEGFVTTRTVDRAPLEVTPEGPYATISTVAARAVVTVVLAH